MPESAYLHPQKLPQQTVTLRWSPEVLPECPVPCLCSARTVSGLFVVENLSGTREQGTVLFPDILRQGTETVQSWAVSGPKKEGKRWKTGELSDHLCHCHSRCWCQASVETSYKESCWFLVMALMLYPCKYIKTLDSKPSSWITRQRLPPLFQDKRKTNSFKCCCKTGVVSIHPFSSQQLLWGGEEVDSWVPALLKSEYDVLT